MTDEVTSNAETIAVAKSAALHLHTVAMRFLAIIVRSVCLHRDLLWTVIAGKR